MNTYAQKNHKGAKPHQKHEKIKQAKRSGNFSRSQVVILKPRKVRTIAALPNGYSSIVYRRLNYFYHMGLFYNLMGGMYTLINPPIGIRIGLLPPNHRRIIMGGRPCFYYAGNYFKQVENNYETIEPIVGTVVPDLPEAGVEKISINGDAFFEHNNYLYKPIPTSKGKAFEMVGKIDI